MASSSTVPAPRKLPTDHMAWKKLMIARPRAASTCTPIAFMATSRAPLPNPISMAPTTATAYVGARPSTTAPAISTGNPTRVTRRAPMESASRPPICIEVIPAAPARKRATAISLAPMSSLARSDGRAPPYPPSSRPLTTNSRVTATTAVRPASGARGGATVVEE